MKTKISSILSGVALLLGLSACEQPHEFAPTQYDDHFTSLLAKFYDDDRDENNFPGEVDMASHTITFVFPYNYPPSSENILTMNDLEKVRVEANLRSGLVLEPALGQINFNEPHQVTVIDPYGKRTQYTVKGEIRKSAECSLTEFVLSDGTTGIINDNKNSVTLLALEDIGEQTATVELSHGATIQPDPATLINYDGEDISFTVTAQNGVDKRVYTITKGEPSKMPFGVREESAKTMWTKKLVDLGIAVDAGTAGATGIGVVDNYLVINDGQKGRAILVNYKTGAVEGEIDLTNTGTDADGLYNNYRLTSDDNNNLLICSTSKTNDGTITIWKKNGTTGRLRRIIQTKAIGNQMGNQLSVVGNLDGDAIITVSANGTAIDFLRWTVKDGELDPNPVTVHASGYAGTCWGTADVTYVDASNPNGRFVIAAYCSFATLPPNASGSNNRTVAMFNSDGSLASYGSVCISSNWVENAGDVLKFNGVPYYIHNSVNTFTWGSDDCIYMYDLGSGAMSTPVFDFTDSGLNINRQYGASAAGAVGRGGNANDVLLHASPDGFYMYIFFMFTNGSVGCIRTDCIDVNI